MGGCSARNEEQEAERFVAVDFLFGAATLRSVSNTWTGALLETSLTLDPEDQQSLIQEIYQKGFQGRWSAGMALRMAPSSTLCSSIDMPCAFKQ